MARRRCDLGKTSLANEGLRRFKLNLGAAERLIEYVKFDLRENRFMVETDGVAGWHNRVFRVVAGVSCPGGQANCFTNIGRDL